MKKNKTSWLKILLVLVIMLPMCIMFTGCDLFSDSSANVKSIASIEKAYSVGLVDYYTITYTDGTTSVFTVTNGKDGRNGTDGTNGDVLTLESIYDIIEDEYEGDIYDFIEEYLSINSTSSNFEIGSAKALLSTVSIYCEFPTTTRVPTYYANGWFAGYKNQNAIECSAGSGVILDLDSEGNAYIITNYHVVYNSSSTTDNKFPRKTAVYIYGQESFAGYLCDEEGNYQKDEDGYQILDYGKYAIEAEVIGGSATNDIAVLKVTNNAILKESDCKSATILNSSSESVVGKTIMAVGNAEGLGISCTKGIVSVDSEVIQMSSVVDEYTAQTFRVIRVDCAVNSGNSGGGLYDANGDLLGIVNAKIVDDGTDNIGYAIPTDVAVSVARNIIFNYENNQTGSLLKPVIGIYSTISDSYAEYDSVTLTTKIHNVIKVVDIQEDSIASTCDIQEGDIIKKAKLTNTVNGEDDVVEIDIERNYQLTDLMNLVKDGSQLTLYLSRLANENLVEVTITFESNDFSLIA